MNDIQRKSGSGNNVTFRSSTFNSNNNNGMESLNLPIDTNKKKNQIEIPSIRFELKLEKPSSDKFSEFNFNKLCLKTFKSMKKINKKNKPDSQEVISDAPKITAITKKDLSIIDGEFQVEKKRVNELLATFRNKVILSKELDREEGEEANDYGDDEYTNESEISVKNSKKSKKKISKGLNGLDLNKFRYADFSHLGKGYDESDSFIDNSDAQDVHIPKNFVPKRGGFYINREQVKLATIDEVKKSKKSSKSNEVKNSDDNSDQSRDEDEADSDEYSESEDSDFEDSEDESENSDDEEEDDEEEEDESDEEEEEGKVKILKTIPEIDLASSSSGSCKTGSNQNVKKPKRIVIDDDENEGKKDEVNHDENNDMTKNKENKLITNAETSIINTKKRKNESQTNEISINLDKIQAKITHTNGELEEIEASTFKKKKLESNQELAKPSLNLQILNEKNRLLNQSNIDNKAKGDDSNDYIDVEEDNLNQTNNKSHLMDTSVNNSINKSNLNISITNQNPQMLPDNLPNDCKTSINKFVDMYNQKINSTSEALTPELKSILLHIYTESKRLKQQSQIFNFLSFKTGRNKDSLFRVCRRILNKETNQSQPSNLASNSNEQIQSTSTQVHKQNNFVTPNLPTTPQTLKTEMDTSLKLKQSPTASPQFSFSDLNDELKTKLTTLKKHYLISKQNQEVSKFLESSQINNAIYSVDLMARSTNTSRNPARMRDFCITYLAEAFEISKDVFLRKYNTIVSQVRQRNLENNLKSKMNELKLEIDKEMPKNADRYTRLLDEFNKNRMNEPNEELRKKMNPPRKKFELTEKTRELILNIIQIKMGLFRTSLSSPSPQNSQQNDANFKLNYIDNFFETELLALWPKNWMQKNVLLNFYQIKYCQQQQMQQQRSNLNTPVNSASQSVNKTPTINSVPTTPVTTNSKQNSSSVINISSKNGKSIKIEQTSMAQTIQNLSPQVMMTKINVSSTPKNLTQSVQQSQINQSKQNVYDTVVNQHKKKPVSQVNTSVNNASFNNSLNMDESYQNANTSHKINKSPHNLFQISNLINERIATQTSSPMSELNKLQQQLNFMLPNLVQNSASLSNLSQTFPSQNSK